MDSSRRAAVGHRVSDIGTRRRITEAIYGTVVMLSVFDYLSDEPGTPEEAIAAVGGGACMLFLGRLYSEAVAVRASGTHNGHDLRRIAAENWPVAAVAAIPVVVLEFAAVGLVSLPLALNIASGIGVAGLAAFGYAAAHVAHAGLRRRVLYVVMALVIGLVVVSLKAAF